jgi:hypothetical protein
MSHELSSNSYFEYPNTYTYSNDEMHRMDDLRAKAVALSACIHKLSIAKCSMLRYKNILRGHVFVLACF